MLKSISPSKINPEEKYLRYHTKSMKLLESHDLDKAQKHLENLNSINSKSSIFELSTLNNLSVVYMKQKLSNKAMITLIKALIKSKSQLPQMAHIGTLLNLTAATSSLGIHSEALTYALKAMSYLSISSDIKLYIISLYNVAVEYIYLQRPLEAEELLRKALTLINENKIQDSTLSSLLVSAINHLLSKKKDIEMITEKSKSKAFLELSSKRKLPRKNNSNDFGLYTKVKTIEKVLKPAKKRTESHTSSRALVSSRKKSERRNGSTTSSTESIKNTSELLQQSLNRSKSFRKVMGLRKSNHHSLSISEHSPLSAQTSEKDLGNRIQNIGDHLSNIEKKLNDFAELCKPLKILTEDPDEQLDSHRIAKCNVEAIVYIQRIARRKFYLKTIAAMKIQRAFRKYRNEKKMKELIKFKDNPLFVQSKKVNKHYVKRSSAV